MANWFDGASADVITHIQKSGWDKLEPAQAAQAAAKSHLEAQNYIGAPADRIIRIPTEPTDPAWKTIWNRLGAKVNAAEYDFSAVKYSDGTAVEDSLVQTMQRAAVELGLPADMARGLMTHLAKYIEDDMKADSAKATATLNTEREALRGEWKGDFDKNVGLAKKAAEALGVKPEVVSKIEELVGYQGIMKMFHSIGTKIGEDKFQGGDGGGNKFTMTKDQAVERMAALKADEGFREKALKGDVEANAELRNLSIIIAGGDDTAVSFERAGR